MTRNERLFHREITSTVLETFFQVHRELGFGFLESIYSPAMAMALMDAGLRVEREVPLAVHFRGFQVGSFRADMIVESVVLLELKATAVLDPSAEPQLLNYLRATNLELGLLLHFGQKARFRRLIYTNDRKLLRVVSV